jgi:hypothetical protein
MKWKNRNTDMFKTASPMISTSVAFLEIDCTNEKGGHRYSFSFGYLMKSE